MFNVYDCAPVRESSSLNEVLLNSKQEQAADRTTAHSHNNHPVSPECKISSKPCIIHLSMITTSHQSFIWTQNFTCKHSDPYQPKEEQILIIVILWDIRPSNTLLTYLHLLMHLNKSRNHLICTSTWNRYHETQTYPSTYTNVILSLWNALYQT